MQRTIVKTAAILGLLAIVLGAFGAHALRSRLTPDALTAFETGVRYQMYHALFLLLVVQGNWLSNKALNGVYWLVLSGVILFSGSIYLLSTANIIQIDLKRIGFVTPIGGFLLIVAWFWLFIDLFRKKS